MSQRRSDALRIVPLKLPETAQPVPAQPAAQLTYRNGPLLAAVEVFVLFWGAVWKDTASELVVTIDNFFDYIVTSPLLDQLAEYSTATISIAHGAYRGSVVVETPAPPASVSDAALRTFLQTQIASNGAVPQPNANSLYFIFLPPDVTVEQGGTYSCQDFCGYHDAIGGTLFYAVEPYPNCSGCNGNFTVADALTITCSHELAEAVTDPVPGQGWYDDSNGEIGDICAWQTKKLGAFTIQLEWSNKANSCL